MRVQSWTAIHAVFAILAATPAMAAEDTWRDVYTCGKSEGQSFYYDETGWTPDGIANGVIILRRKGRDFDLFIGDATSSGFSAREDGATVVGREEDGIIQVLAVYPMMMTMETYLFSAPKDGHTRLAWTSSKRALPTERASVFVSECFERK